MAREHTAQNGRPHGGVERLEITDLALAEHQDTPGMQVRVEPGQCETSLLGVGNRDAALESGCASQQLEIERPRVSQIAKGPSTR